ncbi:serine/threonine-protein kinase [Parvularcula maris]|uniref:Serine/threonine protein kinase n=1 Tax=Parvularcula maris TaxID=2965077 RepID=A0A9X2L6S1_9PROT|nr:serine/threonine-protein kinase [Parvularcula maris]MCQ8184085.1 serine/threonine protein kinase [Parvularcula maris]
MTSKEEEQRLLALLDEAYAVPSEERAAFVRSRTEDDPALRKRALHLLSVESADLATGGALDRFAESQEAPPPPRIGPWVLGEVVGRGGMGAVYRAERDDGAFEQTVAIKLARRRDTGGRLSARLKDELRTLAGLNHPHIAQVFDGGETEDGRPYIVMELVEGSPLHEARSKMNTEARLDAFTDILRAVAYAHSLGVAHRDISPGNVLFRPDGVVKLIDFGISQSLGTDDARLSRARTEGFTAPERMEGEPGGTAADIYSLGRLLSYLAADIDVPRRGDLDAVAAKASAPDPAARYQSVEAMAEDLRRYRQGFPVSTRSGFLTAAARFGGRHPFGTAASLLAVVALVGGTLTASILAVRAQEAETEAVARFDALRGLAARVLFDLDEAIYGIEGTDEARRLTAGIGQEYLEQLEADPRADDMLSLDVARGQVKLAQMVSDTNVFPDATAEAGLPLRRAAGERLERLALAYPDDPAVAATRAWLLRPKIYEELLDNQDPETAAETARLAIGLMETAAAYFPEEHYVHPQRLSLMSDLATALSMGGKNDDAIELMKQGIEEAEELGDAATRGRAYTTAANFRRRIARALANEARWGEADEVLTRSLDDLDRADDVEAPLSGFNLRSRSLAHWQRAYVRYKDGRHGEALEDYAASRRYSGHRLAIDPDSQDAAYQDFLAMRETALPLAALGRFEEAAAAQAEGAAYFLAQLEERPDDPRLYRAMLVQRTEEVEVFKAWGRDEERCERAEDALAWVARLEEADAIQPSDMAAKEAMEDAAAGCS